MVKKQLGQFFTTNADYILQGLSGFVKDKEVIDPFAGSGDLLNWALKNNAKKAIGFDYDKKLADDEKVFFNDSLNNSQEHQFVIANPPYLHKNKANTETKEKFFSGKHKIFEDLYQVSIFEMLKSEEGILCRLIYN
ncbi:MAG: DNA adenine methylase [Patescibacteria group bacterium]